MRSEDCPTPTRTGVRGSRWVMLTAVPGVVRAARWGVAGVGGGCGPATGVPVAGPAEGRSRKSSAAGHPEGPRDEVALDVDGAAADDLHDRVAQVPLERPAAGDVGHRLAQRGGGAEDAQRGFAEVLRQLAGEDLGHRGLQARTAPG